MANVKVSSKPAVLHSDDRGVRSLADYHNYMVAFSGIPATLFAVVSTKEK
jgi:hypothetical protein